MKISKQQLTKVVNEEIQQMVDEGFFGKMGHKMGFETGETKRIDAILGQVASALVDATGDYGLDLGYEDDPVQAVSDFVDRIGALFMKAGLPKEDFAQAKDLMMQGQGQAGADIMYQHFTGMRRTPKGDEARGVIANKLSLIADEIANAEDILRTRYKNKMDDERRAEYADYEEPDMSALDIDDDPRKRDRPGRATGATGSANLAYGEGKVTKGGLKKMIKEIREQMGGEEEQAAAGPDAGALDTAGGGKEKSDVKTALQYIQKVNNRGEYAQMLMSIIKHGSSIPGSKALLTKLYRQLPGMIKQMQEGKLNEDDVQLQPGGNWGQPLPGEEEAGMVDVESLAMDIVQLLEGIEHNDAVDALTLAAETLGLSPPEEERRRIGFVEGKALPPHWLEQGIKADPLCDEKVPDGASMGEYKKCLKNPAAYQRPERRSLRESLRHKLLEESLKRALTNAIKK